MRAPRTAHVLNLCLPRPAPPQPFTLMGLFRFWPVLYPAAYAWLALHLALALGNLAWQRRCMAAHPADGGSWGRWREATAAVGRAAAMAGGIPYYLVLYLLDAAGEAAAPPPRPGDWAGGTLYGSVYFVNVSAAPVLLFLWFKPLRIG